MALCLAAMSTRMDIANSAKRRCSSRAWTCDIVNKFLWLLSCFCLGNLL